MIRRKFAWMRLHRSERLKRMKKTFALCLCCLTVILLVACGQSQLAGSYQTTTIEALKDGSLNYYLVDTFEKEYYELAGLADLAKDEVAKFQEENRSASADCVRVTSVELVEGAKDLVSVNYRFADSASFEKFNHCLFYHGTVGEALDQKIKMLSGYRKVKDQSVVAEIEVRNSRDSRMIITDQKCVLYCELKPYCVSEGVTVLEDGGLDLRECKGNAYIIFK